MAPDAAPRPSVALGASRLEPGLARDHGRRARPHGLVVVVARDRSPGAGARRRGTGRPDPVLVHQPALVAPPGTRHRDRPRLGGRAPGRAAPHADLLSDRRCGAGPRRRPGPRERARPLHGVAVLGRHAARHGVTVLDVHRERHAHHGRLVPGRDRSSSTRRPSRSGSITRSSTGWTSTPGWRAACSSSCSCRGLSGGSPFWSALSGVFIGQFAVGGTDAMFVPLAMLAVWRWDRYGRGREAGIARWLGPIALGLACSIKQTVWFCVPSSWSASTSRRDVRDGPRCPWSGGTWRSWWRRLPRREPAVHHLERGRLVARHAHPARPAADRRRLGPGDDRVCTGSPAGWTLRRSRMPAASPTWPSWSPSPSGTNGSSGSGCSCCRSPSSFPPQLRQLPGRPVPGGRPRGDHGGGRTRDPSDPASGVGSARVPSPSAPWPSPRRPRRRWPSRRPPWAWRCVTPPWAPTTSI